MRKMKPVVTRASEELAAALGLSPLDAIEFEVRCDLNEQIIHIVRKLGLTHAMVAKAAGTSRTRVTAILNRNPSEVSTDLLLRIAAALGYRARITLSRMRPAA